MYMTAQDRKIRQEQNELVKQYENLIQKITFQVWHQLTDRQKAFCQLEDVRSYALEGFAEAIRDYDPKKSSMTFKQYLAYAMRNSCLDWINEESRTIKITYYEQQKLKEENKSTIISSYIDDLIPASNGDDDVDEDYLACLGSNSGFENGEHPIKTLIDAIKKKFDPTYTDIFFSTYGLDGHKEMKGIELAKKYHVSNATITIRVQKVISFIRDNKDLMSVLAELL